MPVLAAIGKHRAVVYYRLRHAPTISAIATPAA